MPTETPTPTIRIKVDPTNPGQFFACCGLLELADRLWPGAEGWFDNQEFCLRTRDALRSILACLILESPEQCSTICGRLPVKPIISPLAFTLDGGASTSILLDFWTKPAKKSGTIIAMAAQPWNLWSGNQKSMTIWQNLRDQLRIIVVGDEALAIAPCIDAALLDLFNQTRALTGRFGFDSTAAWNPQDLGFSPNDQNLAVESSPATEMLAAFGLQRFIPVAVKRVYQFRVWHRPAAPAVAAAMASCGIATEGATYQFEIVKRGQYSAFGVARPIREDSEDD
ncbi:MAG: hypothetical protein IT422_26030 [Pirellulaceae bacterium]|nr:hypothetical protein [Pirellulaceae bacterium]